MPELRAQRDAGVVRVIDLLFVMKDTDGRVVAVETTDLSEKEQEGFADVEGR